MAYHGNTHHEQNNSASGSNIDPGRIFVGGLSWQTTEETLVCHFERYGKVSSVEVMRDKISGDPRGFGFVLFRSDETIDLVLNDRPHEIDHKVVDVKRAQKAIPKTEFIRTLVARGIPPPSNIHPRDAQVSELF
jgi:RNA-binding protein Musashi